MDIRFVLVRLSLVSSLACGGGPAQPSAPPPPTGPPVASFIRTPDGPAIVGVTSVTFQALPDAFGPATYFWNFGDGGAGSGGTVTHRYDLEGTFTVVLTATNATATTSKEASIVIRSLTGIWRPDFLFEPCFTIRLTQTGSTVEAVATNGSPATVAVQSPRQLSLTIEGRASQNCGNSLQNRQGAFDAELNSFTVPIADSGQTDTWRRQ